MKAKFLIWIILFFSVNFGKVKTFSNEKIYYSKNDNLWLFLGLAIRCYVGKGDDYKEETCALDDHSCVKEYGTYVQMRWDFFLLSKVDKNLYTEILTRKVDLWSSLSGGIS